MDDDNDGLVDWDEFRTTFYRVRDDQTGCEPRKLFNLVDFLMLDKNHSGSVDMDECVTLLWSRYNRELVDENLKAMQAENHPSLRADAANEKNVNFSCTRAHWNSVPGDPVCPALTSDPAESRWLELSRTRSLLRDPAPVQEVAQRLGHQGRRDDRPYGQRLAVRE